MVNVLWQRPFRKQSSSGGSSWVERWHVPRVSVGPVWPAGGDVVDTLLGPERTRE